eukprot:TRINITY_DN9548_c0_g1_i1.p1 TRINITY_DN9548_c0_g1~~TRINITY_DN9548_c0_g1_i1.p1  ORF type:complete len:451 (-),score=87.60 TRINITY_DN9548_c0_g1_i1:234-1586(-)
MNMADMQYRNHSIPHDILDELAARFIIPMREEERRDLVRVGFLIEQAHWFYIDFYVNKPEYKLVSGTIKEFSAHIFRHVPFLQKHADRVEEIIDEWREYKLAVPTFGAIIFNTYLDKVLLVQGFWAKASWGFPKGKVNEDEPAHLCAAREVMEETGFDISELMIEDDYVESVINDQTVRLYMIPGVSETTKFQTNTRCEIRDIQWFDVSSLPMNKMDQNSKARLGIAPNSFFMVIPFLRDIKHWIKNKQRERCQFQQGGMEQRSRRASERENYNNPTWQDNEIHHSTPQERKMFDKTPMDNSRLRKDSESGRQRRDSEKLKGAGGSAKVSVKKILTRHDSRPEASKNNLEKSTSDSRVRDKISPAKTPHAIQKSSRKQLFSEGGTPLNQGKGKEEELNEKSKQERKLSKNAQKKQSQTKNHIVPDGFCPKAWQNFKLDHDQLLKIATGRA